MILTEKELEAFMYHIKNGATNIMSIEVSHFSSKVTTSEMTEFNEMFSEVENDKDNSIREIIEEKEEKEEEVEQLESKIEKLDTWIDELQKEKEAIEKAISVFTQSVKKAQKKYVEYEKKTGGIDV